MAKKRGKKAPISRAEQPPAPQSGSNPFEQIFQHKKFDVLGKRSKGQSRKLVKSRTDAVDKRNKSLLVEYKHLRKSNAFLDSRFGEDDPSLSVEDCALARFQKERMKEDRGAKFQLADEGDNHTLTHLGQSLGAATAADRGDAAWDAGFEDGPNEDLPAELVEQFHFGGFERKQGDTGTDQSPDRRSKKEVMEEVMAKSKAFKAAKQKQREDDFDETDALDSTFTSLMQGGMLSGIIKAKGDKQPKASSGAASNEDSVYDRLRRELTYEPKGKVGEATRTAEQLEQQAQANAASIEKARLKRMREEASEDPAGPATLGEGDDSAAMAKGGFAGRRLRQRLAEENAEASHGPSGDALEDDFALDDSAGGSEDASEDESADDESDDDDSSDEEGSSDDESASGDEAPGRDLEGDAVIDTPAGTGTASRGPPLANGLSHTRLRSAHSAELAADKRLKLQAFYGILLQHFAWCARQQLVPMDKVDVLSIQLLEMTAEVPLYAATAARARLSRFLEQLHQGLSEDGDGGWPSVQTLLLLRLFILLFPASDRKHSVLTPAAVLIGAYLTNCHISERHHIATGLLLAQLGLDLSEGESASAASKGSEYMWRASAVLAALGVIERFAGGCGAAAGVPEGLEGAQKLLGKLQGISGLPQELKQACDRALSAVVTQQQSVLSHRQPLRKATKAKISTVKLFNPRFEDEFVSGKDYDPDRERAEKQRLKREVRREQRGAVRELRKDAAYLHGIREQEAARDKAERTTKLRAGMSFMQQQASDMASGGQKGMWKRKKGK
ncbi:hypothetical protein WJX73_000915 [Symbiochloris irregularis]|uniref:Nucleolar protein 14 n=1 Tax=Symbiochloris irregularis TaxID=706552 RepID=A0AAW1NYU5_9CHLO